MSESKNRESIHITQLRSHIILNIYERKRDRQTIKKTALYVIRIRDLHDYHNVIQSHDGVFKLLSDLRSNKIHDNLNSIELFIGSSFLISNLEKISFRAANSNSNVLLLGESGTGKSKLAKLIHLTSNRGDKPFIHMNCASIPYSLVESELFGYEPGALKSGRKGYFESAQNGTIFF